ncbi:hypothetical protein D3C72_1320220 [compost metagenome]
MHLGADVPAIVPAVAFQRIRAVRQQGRQVRQGRGQLGLDVLGVDADAQVQPVGDLHGARQACVHRPQLRRQGVIAGEGGRLILGGEVVGRGHREGDGKAVADRGGDGEVRNQAALDRIDVVVLALDRHGGSARIGDARAGVVDGRVDLQTVHADIDFAAAAGDGGGVPPQRGHAAVSRLARVGPARAAHRLFLQIEGAGEGRRSHGGHEDRQTADAAHVPGVHTVSPM